MSPLLGLGVEDMIERRRWKLRGRDRIKPVWCVCVDAIPRPERSLSPRWLPFHPAFDDSHPFDSVPIAPLNVIRFDTPLPLKLSVQGRPFLLWTRYVISVLISFYQNVFTANSTNRPCRGHQPPLYGRAEIRKNCFLNPCIVRRLLTSQISDFLSKTWQRPTIQKRWGHFTA
jgi:hypothetical protein